MNEKAVIPHVGEVSVGDTIQFPNDPAYYAVLGINEDGIVVKKLDVDKIADIVMENHSELFKRLAND